LLNQFERMVQAMFDVSITVQIGDGTKALFWSDHWLAPHLSSLLLRWLQ
jgi:hypothetical protein